MPRACDPQVYSSAIPFPAQDSSFNQNLRPYILYPSFFYSLWLKKLESISLQRLRQIEYFLSISKHMVVEQL